MIKYDLFSNTRFVSSKYQHVILYIDRIKIQTIILLIDKEKGLKNLRTFMIKGGRREINALGREGNFLKMIKFICREPPSSIS